MAGECSTAGALGVPSRGSFRGLGVDLAVLACEKLRTRFSVTWRYVYNCTRNLPREESDRLVHGGDWSECCVGGGDWDLIDVSVACRYVGGWATRFKKPSR